MEAAQIHEGEMACKSCAKLVNKEEINVCFQTSEAKNLILEQLNKSSEPYLAMMSLIWPDKVLKTTITRDLKCADCLNFIQNIKLDIIATGEWNEGIETEANVYGSYGFTDYFDGFTDLEVQLNKENLFHNDKKSVKITKWEAGHGTSANTATVVRQSSTAKCEPQETNIQTNKQTKSVKILLIIAKAKMFGGHCYLGLSQEDKMIYRYVNISVSLSLILIKIKIFVL